MSRTVVLVSANSEWRALLERFPQAQVQPGPYAWFEAQASGQASGQASRQALVFLHGGWGKVSAAASAQHAVDVFQPRLLVNLGTCGGFAGRVERDEVILVTETLIYDVIERMGDYNKALQFYTVPLDLSWLGQPYPQPVRAARLVSADQDIDPAAVEELAARFEAVAADWESGAIAWVARRNGVRCLILRGVTDLVGAGGGEAYGDLQLFHDGARRVMHNLLDALPAWLSLSGN